MSPTQLIVWNYKKKVSTYFHKLYGHPWAAHAHKIKTAIDSLYEIVKINKFHFSPMFYKTEPWMVLQLIIMDTAIEL
jgi:hypothetical protein